MLPLKIYFSSISKHISGLVLLTMISSLCFSQASLGIFYEPTITSHWENYDDANFNYGIHLKLPIKNKLHSNFSLSYSYSEYINHGIFFGFGNQLYNIEANQLKLDLFIEYLFYSENNIRFFGLFGPSFNYNISQHVNSFSVTEGVSSKNVFFNSSVGLGLGFEYKYKRLAFSFETIGIQVVWQNRLNLDHNYHAYHSQNGMRFGISYLLNKKGE